MSHEKEQPVRAPDAETAPLEASPQPPPRLPQPEDFTDPAVAEAVRAMREALQATGWSN